MSQVLQFFGSILGNLMAPIGSVVITAVTYPFFLGAYGASTTILMYPLDTLKVQMQVVSEQRGKNIKNKFTFMFDVAKEIYQTN